LSPVIGAGVSQGGVSGAHASPERRPLLEPMSRIAERSPGRPPAAGAPAAHPAAAGGPLPHEESDSVAIVKRQVHISYSSGGLRPLFAYRLIFDHFFDAQARNRARLRVLVCTKPRLAIPWTENRLKKCDVDSTRM
jgi:hypothetical protein